MATIMCTEHRSQMSTVRPGVFDRLPKDDSKADKAKIEKVAPKLADEDLRIKVLEAVKELKEVADISEAQVKAIQE